jgi:hypothetical protein
MSTDARNVVEHKKGADINVTLGEDVSTNAQLIAIKASDEEGYIATDAAGYQIAGVIMEDGDEGDERTCRQGLWFLGNSSSNALSADDIGSLCYVEDSRTVASTSTYSLVAGTVKDVRDYGVLVDVGVNTATTASA